MLSYTISNYRMTQFWRVLTQSHSLLVFLYHSQEMWIALVKKQIRPELGSLHKIPQHTVGPIMTALLDGSGSTGILCTNAAQNIESHGYHYWYMFGIGKTALKIGVSYVSPKKKSRPWKSRFKTSYTPILSPFLFWARQFSGHLQAACSEIRCPLFWTQVLPNLMAIEQMKVDFYTHYPSCNWLNPWLQLQQGNKALSWEFTL